MSTWTWELIRRDDEVIAGGEIEADIDDVADGDFIDDLDLGIDPEEDDVLRLTDSIGLHLDWIHYDGGWLAAEWLRRTSDARAPAQRQ